MLDIICYIPFMDTPYNTPITGCVLAGGKSRRMGADKALLELDGKTLIAIALEKFSGLKEIFISAAGADDYAFTGFRTIPDDRPGIGPLGGFISALKAAESELVCFRPVDAPFVPSGLHPLLARACYGRDAAVPVSGNLQEPLLACLSKSALPVLENLAAANNFKAADAYPLLDTVYVNLDDPEMISAFGDPSVYLVNANDAVTFEKLRSGFFRSSFP